MPLKSDSGKRSARLEPMIYWWTISINCQTAMMAVCGWEPQLHVPNGMKGWRRMKKSSTGSAKMLGLPLSASQRYQTVCQKAIGKCHIWQDMERSCQVCSCQAGHTTSSTSCQGSRVDYCPVAWYIRAVYTTWSIVWRSESTDKTKWQCHDCRWASETCSWFKQTPWQHGHHRQWTNILVHLSIITHDEGILLLVGEGVRYHISYC